MTRRDDDAGPDRSIDYARRRTTTEVGSEGGSPGNVEVGVDRAPAGGSEAEETVKPKQGELTERVFDDTGEGRRNP